MPELGLDGKGFDCKSALDLGGKYQVYPLAHYVILSSVSYLTVHRLRVSARFGGS
jgi:hypothetical protein